jgi:uncharacterized protein YeaO (DUF488 family)
LPLRCTKHVYAPPEADDGCRIIVMRRYPRGIAKWRAHGFLPELAPTLPLVLWYHEQKDAIEAQWRNTDPERFGTEIARFWRVYRRRYISEMRHQRPLIEWLSALERDFGLTLTLLCAWTTTASAIAACSPISSRRAPPADLDADDFDPPDPIVAVVVI